MYSREWDSFIDLFLNQTIILTTNIDEDNTVIISTLLGIIDYAVSAYSFTILICLDGIPVLTFTIKHVWILYA